MIGSDLKELGYLFQWSRLDAQKFLLLQRRNRIYGTGDLDEGQNREAFCSKMSKTLESMAGDLRFSFSDVFDETLPPSPVEGNALNNVKEAMEAAALKNTSMNLFVDTATSSKWGAESAEGVVTCVRPSHAIFSVKLNKCITAREMLLCQGIFSGDFRSPSAVEEVVGNPKFAQDLAGNAFASTCAQAQTIASLVNAFGCKRIGSPMENVITPTKSCADVSGISRSSSSVGNDDDANGFVAASDDRTPSTKRKSGMAQYLEGYGKRSKFDPAPAAKAHQDRVECFDSC